MPIHMRRAWPILRRTPIRTPIRILLLIGIGAGCTGCIKPLFPVDTPRTQFETYDRMRSRYVPLEEPDVFGVPRPALRARLTPPE